MWHCIPVFVVHIVAQSSTGRLLRNRGYYTVARRCEFYVRVARTISHEWHSEWVTYCSCHRNIKFISSSQHVMFFSLYKHSDDDVFDDFPEISGHFPKIFQNCSEGQMNIRKHFWRISEYFRRLPKTFEEDPQMFRWYTNKFKYNNI